MHKETTGAFDGVRTGMYQLWVRRAYTYATPPHLAYVSNSLHYCIPTCCYTNLN